MAFQRLICMDQANLITYLAVSKSRREYAARGSLLSRSTEKESKRHPFGTKWEKRGLKGNLERRLFARWHAFSPVQNAEIHAVRPRRQVN